jgi:hypothetical protein
MIRLLADAHAACEIHDFMVRPIVLGELKLSHNLMRLVGWIALAARRQWTRRPVDKGILRQLLAGTLLRPD